MQLISTSTVGAGGASSITFSSIPQTYTDLVLVLSARTTWTSTVDTLALNINSANSSGLRLEGTGSSTASGSAGSYMMIGYVNADFATANTFSDTLIYIPNYTAAAAKTWAAESVTENIATQARQTIVTGVCSNTSATTSVSIFFGSGNLVQNSTASLYGILKGSGGATVS